MMDARFQTSTQSRDEQLTAERKAAIQPKPESDSMSRDLLNKTARKKVAGFTDEELQREILAQLYVQNHFLTMQTRISNKIKGHLVFYTIMFCLSFLLGIAIAGNA